MGLPSGRTCWGFLLHFHKVGSTLVVQLPFAAIIKKRNLELFLYATLHLPYLQGSDAVGTI